ncbi:hypothetical protein PAMA_002376 [Pampus argenteus]
MSNLKQRVQRRLEAAQTLPPSPRAGCELFRVWEVPRDVTHTHSEAEVVQYGEKVMARNESLVALNGTQLSFHFLYPVKISYIGHDCGNIPDFLGDTYGQLARRLDLSFNELRIKGVVDKCDMLIRGQMEEKIPLSGHEGTPHGSCFRGGCHLNSRTSIVDLANVSKQQTAEEEEEKEEEEEGIKERRREMGGGAKLQYISCLCEEIIPVMMMAADLEELR